ncbi:hypothetical protein KIN20_010660 [Parelaphostrongylus tenuis]|uniref:Uncharacterized protein n=1 Tax=Parelaphostrongylus tenuis TaxID=148309 RepID=A0AAD5QLY7_PARTN|nr:hypothetical protein KIN20_010660 [Parelaphostrongylus tenuis]
MLMILSNSLYKFDCAKVMDRKNEGIPVVAMHKTRMKTVDIVKFEWFQTSKCLQSRETFSKKLEVIEDCIEKIVRPPRLLRKAFRSVAMYNEIWGVRCAKWLQKPGIKEWSVWSTLKNKLKLRSYNVVRVNSLNKI